MRGLNERMPLHKEIDVSMCNGILRIWLGHFGSSAHLIGDRMVSFETIRSTPPPDWMVAPPPPPGRGLNEIMPLHKEINVSMCNDILRIWLGHFGSSAHLIGDRMVSFETIRSGPPHGSSPRPPKIEWFQLKPFDLGCPKLDPRDRMVSIETIRYP